MAQETLIGGSSTPSSAWSPDWRGEPGSGQSLICLISGDEFLSWDRSFIRPSGVEVADLKVWRIAPPSPRSRLRDRMRGIIGYPFHREEP